MRFKGGKRSSMGVVERAFARVYDRLRKRALRRRSPFYTPGVEEPLWLEDYQADSYLDGVRDALDAVAVRLEQEGVTELAEMRGSGV